VINKIQKEVRIGIIGGGLMGKELLALVRRWDALVDHPIRPTVTAVADVSSEVQEWFRRAGVPKVYSDYKQLLDNSDIDLLYIAVPHNLHEEIYIEAAKAGKDFLGEKPFGIDLQSATKIAKAVEESGVFVRVSSELPFFPGAQAAIKYADAETLGEIVEVRAGLLHSSDIDINKAINWKRQNQFCGDIGVMGDLGMHVAHVPLRLGWKPKSVYALLDDIVPSRKNKDGESIPCDTYENAMLALKAETATQKRQFPMFWEMKRIAPGESNTWFFHAMGMKGGVYFSTRNPQVYQRFTYSQGEQSWSELQPGHKTNWPVITGAIFEFGFPDALLQMWAAFLAEREGVLGDRFACATIAEALEAHKIFRAALTSQNSNSAESI
jgi:predicted dehydrogenase